MMRRDRWAMLAVVGAVVTALSIGTIGWTLLTGSPSDAVTDLPGNAAVAAEKHGSPDASATGTAAATPTAKAKATTKAKPTPKPTPTKKPPRSSLPPPPPLPTTSATVGPGCPSYTGTNADRATV